MTKHPSDTEPAWHVDSITLRQQVLRIADPDISNYLDRFTAVEIVCQEGHPVHHLKVQEPGNLPVLAVNGAQDEQQGLRDVAAGFLPQIGEKYLVGVGEQSAEIAGRESQVV